MYEIIHADINSPATSFQIGWSSETAKLRLKLNYPRIAITGDGNATGKSVNKVCVRKAGIQNSLSVVNVERC